MKAIEHQQHKLVQQLLGISIVLGHSVVYFSKEDLSPNGIVNGATAGGDPPAPQTSESMDSIMKAYKTNLPDLINMMSAQYPGLEHMGEDVRASIAPQEAALNAGLMQQYLPVYSQAASDAEKQALTSNGPDIVHAADKLAREVDQPFYDTRDLASGKLKDLLGGMDPNQLTEGEMANAERGLNRTNYRNGELQNPSMTGAIKSAMTFGDALDKKKANVANAINSATQFMGNSRTGVDTFSQATGRGGTQSFGNNLFQGPGTGGQAFNQGGNMFNAATGLQTQGNQINADRRDSLDRFTGFMSSLPNISG